MATGADRVAARGRLVGLTYELREERIWRVRVYLGYDRALEAASNAA
jgi:hypothetical protein